MLFPLRFSWLLLSSAVAVGLLALPAQADDVITGRMRECSAVLVPDDLRTSHSKDSNATVYDAACGTWYAQHRETVDSAIEGKAIFKVVSVGAGSSKSSDTQSVTRTAFCQQSNHQTTEETKDTFFSLVVPKVARDKWLECIKTVSARMGNDGPRPVATTLTTTSGNAATLSLRFLSDFGGARPTFKSLTPTNLNCDTKLAKNKPIPSQGSGLAIPCTWVDGAAEGVILVHTSRGDEIVPARRWLPPIARVTITPFTTSTIVDSVFDTCNDWYGSTDMHNWKKDGNKDGRCDKASDDGKWCKQSWKSVLRPAHGGVLSGFWWNCRGGDGSCGWNDIPGHQWFRDQGDGSWLGEVWLGSRAVEFALCGKETTYKKTQTPGPTTVRDLQRGESFTVDVPEAGSAAVAILWTSDNREESFNAGDAIAGMTLKTLSVGPLQRHTYTLNR